MVKHFFILATLLSYIYANTVTNAIKDVLGKSEFNSKKKFIEIIFKDKDSFKDGSYLDYPKILQKLRDEGLLKLSTVSSPLRVAFTTNSGNNQIFIKVVKDTLFSLGFSNIDTIKVVKRGKKFIWVVSLGNNYMLDPLLFSKSMKEKNIYIEGLKRYSVTNWNYVLNVKNAVIIPKKLEYNDIIKLQKSLRSYWLNIEDAKKVQIQSSLNNSWHPYVVLYNKDLKIISTVKKDKKTSKLDINVPSDAMYLKIDDLYTIKNIRDGLNILIQKRE